MRKDFILSTRSWGKIRGITEEILYNIKTVASFESFVFEKNKFKKK